MTTLEVPSTLHAADLLAYRHHLETKAGIARAQMVDYREALANLTVNLCPARVTCYGNIPTSP